MNTTVATTKPNVVNGINVDDLVALLARVKQDASQGKTTWRVTTTWQGQTRSRAEVSGFAIGGEEVSRQFVFDIDEPYELGGSNAFMTVGYVAQCAIRGITLTQLKIETEGEIDLRGFLGIDPTVPPGYKSLSYTVRLRGDGTPEQFAEIHAAVMATSPNFYNVANAVALQTTLV